MASIRYGSRAGSASCILRSLKNLCESFGIMLSVKLAPSQKIYLSESRIKNAGRGVFALVNVKKDEVIETCPVILIKEQQVSKIRHTELLNYYFMWGHDRKNHKAAICLGFGSLYNHSYSPNTTYNKLLDEELIAFIAIKDIKKDEEITVNYNYGNPKDKSPLWIKEIKPAE